MKPKVRLLLLSYSGQARVLFFCIYDSYFIVFSLSALIASADAKGGRKAKGRVGAYWGDESTSIFLEVYLIWSAKFARIRSKKLMWGAIAAHLWQQHDVDYSAEQCQEKLKCLTAYFNTVLRSRDPKKYKFYDAMMEITNRPFAQSGETSVKVRYRQPPCSAARKSLFVDDVYLPPTPLSHSPPPPTPSSHSPAPPPPSQSPPLEPAFHEHHSQRLPSLPEKENPSRARWRRSKASQGTLVCFLTKSLPTEFSPKEMSSIPGRKISF